MPSFRFGQPTTNAYASPQQVVGSVKLRGSRVVADSNNLDSGGSSFTNNRYNPIHDRLDQGSVFEDWVPRDAAGINKMLRYLHLRDTVSGPTIDHYATIPWSEFDITGIKDPMMRRFYEEAFAMYTPDVMTYISKEILIIGRYCASLAFNPAKGYFDDFANHDPDFLDIVPTPFRNHDPIIDLRATPTMRNFMASQDERIKRIRALVPRAFIERFNAGTGRMPLEPLSTLFLARKISPTDVVGTSMLTRLLGPWSIEKALMDATVTAARRRVGAIMHVSAGIDGVWEPDATEIDNIASLFIQAEEDPVGAVVATRTGVQVNEPRAGGQVWKLSDEWAQLTEMKMRALGVSDAFLNGEACMVGSTLVPTVEHGIIRLGDIRKKEDGKWQDLSITVGSRYGQAKTKKWYYNGQRPTLLITSKVGHSIQCTYNHPLLVLNGHKTEWRRADELKVGDLICATTKPVLRTTPLELNLQSALIDVPARMTPSLAFLLGIVTRAGEVSKARGRVEFAALHHENAKQVLLDCQKNLMEVFGVNVDTNVDGRPATVQTFHGGVLMQASHTGLVDLFLQLGCVPDNADRRIPWSILQADVESQRAFMRAYMMGEGCNDTQMSFSVPNSEIRQEFLTLMSAHGIVGVASGSSLHRIHEYDMPLRDVDGTKYLPVPIDAIQMASVEDVYDLSMNDGVEPAFVANGIVCHNTYSNMETARTIFMEQILAFRSQVTHQLFGKLSSTLARTHGFVNNPKRAAYNGQIRVTPDLRRDNETHSVMSPYMRALADAAQDGDESAEREFKRRLAKTLSLDKALRIPGDQLVTPTIHWRKDMKPTQDEAYLGLLDKMEEKGIPVPKRIWAAAGGYDLDAALEMMEEDRALTQKIAEATGEPAEPDEGGADMGDLGDLGAPEGPGGDSGAPPEDKLSEDLKSLDKLAGPGGDAIKPEKPAGGGDKAPKKNPVTHPAPPADMKPHSNPLAFVKRVQEEPLWRDNQFAGLKREVAVAMAKKVEQHAADMRDPAELRALLGATVKKEQAREVAAYLCRVAGLPVAMQVSAETSGKIAEALCMAEMAPAALARRLSVLSEMVVPVPAEKAIVRTQNGSRTRMMSPQDHHLLGGLP